MHCKVASDGQWPAPREHSTHNIVAAGTTSELEAPESCVHLGRQG